jgi:hypothetical protein
MKIPFLKSALLVSLGLLCACEPVEPWERGNLAKPQMALDPNPTHSVLRDHTFGSRQAAASSATAAGGGCGCN